MSNESEYEKDAGGTFCAVCKRPYAFTERLSAGLEGLDTAKEYHEKTHEHLNNLKGSGVPPTLPKYGGSL